MSSMKKTKPNMNKNPRQLHIDNMGFKDSVKKSLKKAGLKTAYDVAEYHNRRLLSEIDGINKRHIWHIAKVLHQETNMILPDINHMDDVWEWATVKRIVKIFIAQPMSGRADDDVLYERCEAMKEIMDWFTKYKPNCVPTFLDQYYVDDAPKDATPVWYLGHSIMILAKADYIYFTGNWCEARGCNIEYEIAKTYEIPILNDKMIL